jgi:hypothetical protein
MYKSGKTNKGMIRAKYLYMYIPVKFGQNPSSDLGRDLFKNWGQQQRKNDGQTAITKANLKAQTAQVR